MPKIIITAEQFESLGDFEKLTEKYYIFSLGVGLQYEYSPRGIRYSAPYEKMGKMLWNAFKNELYEIICNRYIHEPNEWVNDLITGDIRNLIVGIVSAITVKYDVTIGIALPVAALIAKTGILKFCSEPSQKSYKQSVQQILDNKKNQFKEVKQIKKSKKGQEKKSSKNKKK